MTGAAWFVLAATAPTLLGGTPVQWLITLFSGGTFAAVLTFVYRWRSLTVSAENRLRDHYAAELTRLTKKLDDKSAETERLEKHLRDMVTLADERYEECQLERENDRRTISDLRSELDGVKRQIARYSADQLMILESQHCPSPEVSAAARRTKRITGDVDGQ